MSESSLTIITSIGRGFVSGILLGYFLKKSIKIIIFVAGGIVGQLLFLQHQRIISMNTGKLENSLTFIASSFQSSFDSVTHTNDTNLGIPLPGGLSAGLAIGFVKG